MLSTQERAARAALVPARVEHEVVDDELAAALEQVEQARLAVRALEDVVLVDLDHRQLAGARRRARRAARVSSFSSASSALRAASHSSREAVRAGSWAGPSVRRVVAIARRRAASQVRAGEPHQPARRREREQGLLGGHAGDMRDRGHGRSDPVGGRNSSRRRHVRAHGRESSPASGVATAHRLIPARPRRRASGTVSGSHRLARCASRSAWAASSRARRLQGRRRGHPAAPAPGRGGPCRPRRLRALRRPRSAPRPGRRGDRRGRAVRRDPAAGDCVLGLSAAPRRVRARRDGPAPRRPARARRRGRGPRPLHPAGERRQLGDAGAHAGPHRAAHGRHEGQRAVEERARAASRSITG